MAGVVRSERRSDVSPVLRLGSGAIAGAVAGLAVRWPDWLTAVLAGWALGVGLFVGWTWLAIATMDPDETRVHATREEPTRPGSEVVLVLAALAGLAGVVGVLVGGAHGVAPTLVTFAAILASWAAVHTVSALRYARIYFTDGGGIDFHQQDPPRYSDFAYVALTVGMSFAISDTDLASSRMRAHALRQALLSYLFGTVVIAMVVNVVAGSGGAAGG